MVINNSVPSCVRCGKKSMLTDDVTGEQFCAKCGYVVSEKADASGPEWRSFQKDGGSDPARTGAPSSLTIHDMGLSTVINPLNKDASGKPLAASMKSTIERLRTWDSRSQAHQPVDRNLRQALGELNKLKDKVSVSANVLEKAAYDRCRIAFRVVDRATRQSDDWVKTLNAEFDGQRQRGHFFRGRIQIDVGAFEEQGGRGCRRS